MSLATSFGHGWGASVHVIGLVRLYAKFAEGRLLAAIDACLPPRGVGQ